MKDSILENVSSLDLTLFSEDGGSEGDVGSDGEFDELIKGRFKDAYTKRTQNMINRRFKDVKQLESFKERATELIGAASRYFGVGEDVGEILDAISRGGEGSSALPGEGASEAPPETPDGDGGSDGADGESAGNDAPTPKERVARAAAADRVAALYSDLLREAEETKEKYPSFDLEEECRDKRFTRLISSGLGVRGAYEALHHDELLRGAMQYAADRVYEAARCADALSSERPSENGVSSGGAPDAKRDVASMTSGEILSILKRVKNGEKIRF